MMYFDQKISTIRASVNTNPTRTVDSLSDQAGYWEMDETVDFIELLEDFRDQASSLATRYVDGSLGSMKMRVYLMGMSDAYASMIALLVDGDPNVAMQSNAKQMMEQIRRRIQDGQGQEDYPI